jgi:hypothetical protein
MCVALLSTAAFALLLNQVYGVERLIFGALPHNNFAVDQMCCEETTGTKNL